VDDEFISFSLLPDSFEYSSISSILPRFVQVTNSIVDSIIVIFHEEVIRYLERNIDLV
jgi:hypothetical protein